MNIIIAIAGFLMFCLWSVVVLAMGFMSGRLSEKDAQEKQGKDSVECTFAAAMDNPTFSRFIQNKPMLKELLVMGSVCFLEITDETIEIAIAAPINHQEAINKAMEDALEINLLYEVN
jgi:hypothetical protein